MLSKQKSITPFEGFFVAASFVSMFFFLIYPLPKLICFKWEFSPAVVWFLFLIFLAIFMRRFRLKLGNTEVGDVGPIYISQKEMDAMKERENNPPMPDIEVEELND